MNSRRQNSILNSIIKGGKGRNIFFLIPLTLNQIFNIKLNTNMDFQFHTKDVVWVVRNIHTYIHIDDRRT